MDVTSTIEVITPEVAHAMLGRNLKNRAVNKSLVSTYVRDMKNGAWQVTGEAIKIDSHGTMLDGQHRCLAVIESETSVPMLVVRGIAPSAQSVMDTGRKRSAADMLTLTGYHNTTTLAASARMCIAIPRGGYAAARSSSSNRATNTEIATFIAENPGIIEATSLAVATARGIDAPPAVIGYSAFRLMAIEVQQAHQFFIDACEKANLPKGDPALTLAHRLAEARRSRERLTNEMMISLIFRAWNTRRSGKTLSLLRVNSSKGGIIEVPEPR
jgi:hypothetical protein